MALFVSLFLSVGAIYAQMDRCDLVLHGQVIDMRDRSPLGFAHVQLVHTGQSVAADADGRFQLKALCPGRHLLRFSHVGYTTREQEVQLTADTAVVLPLEHQSLPIREVEVSGNRQMAPTGHARGQVTKAEMEARAGLGLAEMIDRISGVTVLRTGPTIGKPVIHGLSGTRVLTLNQGVRQEDQQWGAEHGPSIDPLSSDRITVVKGAASVQYGADAIGGVVITEPVDLPVGKGLSGELRTMAGLNGRGGGASGALQGGVDRWKCFGWRVQGSGRIFGDQQAPGYILSNTGQRDRSGSASAGWTGTDRSVRLYYSYFERQLGILRAAHIGNLADLQSAIASGRPWYTAPFTHAIEVPRQHVRHHLAKADTRLQLHPQLQLLATYAFQLDQRAEYDRRRGGRDTIPALDLHLRTHTGDLVLKHTLLHRLHGRFGLSASHQENVNLPGTGVRPLIPNYRRRNAGIFLLEHFHLGRRLAVEAGVRVEGTVLDVFTYTDAQEFIAPRHTFFNHAASVGIDLALHDSIRLRTIISTAYRPPHVSELYSEGLHHGAASIEIGDPGLDSEQAVKGAAELTAFAFNGRLRIDLTMHAAKIDGYIQLRPDGYRLTIRGAFPVFRYVAADTWLHGIDASAQWAFSERWSWRSRFSMLRGRDLSAGTWLFQMPADRVENSLVFRMERSGNWREPEVALIATSVWRQTRVPTDMDFTDPPQGYHLLGCQAGIARPLGTGELRIACEVRNVLDTPYRDYLDRFRYYADAAGVDIILRIRYAFGRS